MEQQCICVDKTDAHVPVAVFGDNNVCLELCLFSFSHFIHSYNSELDQVVCFIRIPMDRIEKICVGELHKPNDCCYNIQAAVCWLMSCCAYPRHPRYNPAEH